MSFLYFAVGALVGCLYTKWWYKRPTEKEIADSIIEAHVPAWRDSLLDSFWYARLLTMGEIQELADKYKLGTQWGGAKQVPYSFNRKYGDQW